ncbi:MAG TPA: DUF6455 family protein [Thermohalobaculum sp.]|nr:DUF6455 family protein [Thermohalobaculum sp.]
MNEKAARHWGLMNAMANKTGVDLGLEYLDGSLSRSAMRNAIYKCTECKHVTECETLLDRDGGVMESTPDYCLNKQLLSGLRAHKN